MAISGGFSDIWWQYLVVLVVISGGDIGGFGDIWWRYLVVTTTMTSHLLVALVLLEILEQGDESFERRPKLKHNCGEN